MVKTKRGFIFATFLTSGLAVVVSCVALGTPYWASADVKIQSKLSNVHYGLFQGIYTRTVATSTALTYDLYVTCLISDNVCAMLCESTSTERTNTLTDLFNNGDTATFKCDSRNSRTDYFSHEQIFTRVDREDSEDEKYFMNAGLWLCTIIFLALSCTVGLGASLLAMWNTIYNPIEVYFNITGLYIWNSVACFFSLLAMVMWGVMFGVTLVNDICVFDTIKKVANSENAVLHFSYWLNLLALILYIVSMVILAVRQYLINKEPVVTHIIDESADPGILLF